MASGSFGNRDQGYGTILNDGRGRVSMLDRALEGATAEAKARVLGVLLRYGIDEDNEFFMIFVAIGHLLVLVEEAPENWQAFFDDIYGELNQWSSQNRKSLESLKLHTQTSAQLIQSLQRLIASMTASDDKSNKMLEMLNSLENRLSCTGSNSDSIRRRLNEMSEVIQFSSTKHNNTDNSIRHLQSIINQQNWILSVSFWFSLALVIGGCFLWRQNTQLQIQQQEQAEKMEWLLEKANRAECHYGIKPADDPQCQ